MIQKTIASFTLLCLLSAGSALGQPVSSPTEFRQQPFDVQHYELDVTIRTPSSKFVEGQVQIRLLWTESLTSASFPIHARGINIDSVLYHGDPIDFYSEGNSAVDTFHYRAALGKAVTKGQADSLTVFYSGVMTTEGGSNAWGGVWYEGQVLYALGVGFHNPSVSATQHWMPCYDHPSDKATFRGTFRVPRSVFCASVGILELVEIPRGDSIRAIVWNETHPTATYLYTFAVGQFEKLELTDAGVQHQIYSLPADTAASQITYRLVPSLTKLYSDHFGSYPFDKVGYVNTRRGAMEHQTMISFPTSEVAKRDSHNLVVGHELAHSWFGDYVSPLDFRHAWLTESFATYAEAMWVEKRAGWDAYLTVLTDQIKTYKEVNAVAEGVFPLVNFPRASPSSNYPRTIYTKGQIVVAMLRALVGDSAFYSSLRSYLNEHAYGTATTEDMQNAMRTALGPYADDFFDQWVYGKGWPKLAVTLAPGHSSWIASISQVQHMSSLDWDVFTAVPLNITYRDPTTGELVDSMFIMTRDTMTIEMATPEGFALNAGSKCRSLIDVASITTVMEPELDSYGFVLNPNPAFDSATVTRERVDENALVEIYDAAGRNMFSAILLEQQADLGIDISRWPAGSYTIRMISQQWASALPMLIVR